MLGTLLASVVVFRCPGQEVATEAYKLAIAQYHHSDWDGAITHFSEAIAAGVELSDSYSYRAYAFARKGESNAAMADCAQLQQLLPNAASTFYWRSRVELALTNHEAALFDYMRGRQLNAAAKPLDLTWDLAHHCSHSASVQLRAGDLNQAMTNINRAIVLIPTNGLYYEKRAQIRLLQGQYNSAITNVSLGLKYDPNGLVGYEVSAFARMELNDPDGARDDCEKGLANYAKQISQFANLGDRLSYQLDSFWLQGLQSYIHGDYDTAAKRWTDLVEQHKAMNWLFQDWDPPVGWQKYLQKWTDKARANQKPSIP